MISVVGAVESIAGGERWLLAAGLGLVYRVGPTRPGRLPGPSGPGPGWRKEIVG